MAGTIGADVKALYEDYSAEQVRIVEYRCHACKMVNRVAVLPWSPQIAKVVCRNKNCERLQEVETRESFMMGREFSDHLLEGYSRNDFEKRKPVTNSRVVAGPAEAVMEEHRRKRAEEKRRRIEAEVDAVRRAFSEGEKVRTIYGDATLIN